MNREPTRPRPHPSRHTKKLLRIREMTNRPPVLSSARNARGRFSRVHLRIHGATHARPVEQASAPTPPTPTKPAEHEAEPTTTQPEQRPRTPEEMMPARAAAALICNAYHTVTHAAVHRRQAECANDAPALDGSRVRIPDERARCRGRLCRSARASRGELPEEDDHTALKIDYEGRASASSLANRRRRAVRAASTCA